YLSNGLGLSNEELAGVEPVVDEVISDLHLDTSEKQARVSLWTRGPRFMLIKAADLAIVDAQGVLQLLHTLFVGLRHSGQRRGGSFEEQLREKLTRRKFELVQRIYRFSTGEREVDAAVRIGDTLWLVEAHSMERPLTYEIGRPDVIQQRN